MLQERGITGPVESGGDSTAIVDEQHDIRQQLEDLQREHASILLKEQSTTEMLKAANEDNTALTGELRSVTGHLKKLQDEREALVQEQASWSGQLQQLQRQLESQEGANLELQQACQRQEDCIGQMKNELAESQDFLESLQQHVSVITAQREEAVSKANAASELQAEYEKAAEQLEELQSQLHKEQRLHALHLAEAAEAHQSLKAEAHANMQQAEEDRRLALSLAEERLQEIQALRADLQKVVEAPMQLPAPAVDSSANTAGEAGSADGMSISEAEQHITDSTSIADAVPPEETLQSNPLFSPVREVPLEAAASHETPSALASRKPGAAMRKIKELQAALNRKNIELVALQAQLQAALAAAQGRQQADEV